MAKSIPLDNIAHARAFIEKFGIGEITVDEFDMFIIDRGLAVDPGTTDVKDNAYKGFVQTRNAARRLLNTAGAWINGSSFQITVAETGKTYKVTPWALDANEFAKNVTKQVGNYVSSRVAHLKAMRNKAEGLIQAYGDDDDLHDSMVMLSSMTGHGVSMQAKVAGLLKQYDTAYTMVVAQMEEAIQRRLEEKNDE